MKINEKHIAFVIRQKNVKESLKAAQMSYADKKYGVQDADSRKKISDVFDKVCGNIQKSYIIRKSAWGVIDKIKIDGSFDYSILGEVANTVKEIIVDEKTVYRFSMDDSGELRVLNVWLDGLMVRYHSFVYFTMDGTTSENIDEVRASSDRFLRILIFLYFSVVTEEILKPMAKIGMNKELRIKNETTYPFIVVDTTWNRTIVRSDGFVVSGHFRLQAYGEGRAKRKLIFIDEFEKAGYKRTAKGVLVGDVKNN